MMVVLRLLHIGSGVFWAGAVFFLAIFLEPSVRAALPESGKVMQQLIKRGVLNIVPAFALVTVLTGIEMLRRDSSGFHGEWLGSPMGLSLLAGGIAALVALALGLGVLRPAQLRMVALGPAAQQAEGAEKERLQAELAMLRHRAMIAIRVIAVLLGVTVVAMAVARYV